MFIDGENFTGLPVITKGGLLLGKIKSFEVDAENQTIERYVVKSRSLVGKLLGEPLGRLIIGRNQVISIDQDKMVVEDGAVKEKEAVRLLRGAGKDVPALSSRLSLKTDGE